MKFLNRISHYPAPIRLGIFILVLLGLWLPLAALIYLLQGDPNLTTIVTMVLLYGLFIFLLRFWSRKVYQQPRFLQYYGLEGSRKNGVELIQGLAIGLILTLALFITQGSLGWLSFQGSPHNMLRITLEGLLMALAVGFAEELLFRGWLLSELQKDYAGAIANWSNAAIFAALHFIKPLSEIIRTFPQFPGLLLLGIILVWATQSCRGRLGLPIGLHAGLVWGYYIISVGDIVQYTDTVSPLITGVDRNPLAGAMGLLFLGGLAVWMRRRKGKLAVIK